MMKTLTQLLVALLVALVFAFAFMAVKNGKASSANDIRPDACRTFHIFAHEKQIEKQAETDGLMCGNGIAAVTVKQAETSNNEAAVTAPMIVTVEPVTVVTVEPAPSVEPVKESKDKCNNGNGNGAEGCNASDKGNQDETTVKGDKDIAHPTH